MKSRIDTSGTTFVCTRAPEPRTAFDTGQPKIDQPTGLPLAGPADGLGQLRR
jgi:hypothetical protein